MNRTKFCIIVSLFLLSCSPSKRDALSVAETESATKTLPTVDYRPDETIEANDAGESAEITVRASDEIDKSAEITVCASDEIDKSAEITVCASDIRENLPTSSSESERPHPERCRYRAYAWDVVKKRSVDGFVVDKRYDEVEDGERDPSDARCTVCEQDQVVIDLRAEGIDLPPIRVCYVYAGRVTEALREIRQSGDFIFTDMVAYRPGKTRGKVIDDKRSEWSNHSFGTAIDINAKHNGLYRNCRLPVNRSASDILSCKLGVGGAWDPERKARYSVVRDGAVYKAFTKFWKWGGEIPGTTKDIMHFSNTGF